MNDSRPKGRAKSAGSWFLGGLLWVVALGLAGVLSTRHDLRVDLSYGARRSLSAETVRLLRKLEQPVHAYAFYADDPTARGQIHLLLERYRQQSQKFSYEFVDPDRRPELAEKYGVSLNRTLVLSSGELKLRVRDVTESRLSGALLRLMSHDTPRVLFVTGHGEASIENQTGRGLSKLAESLRQQNFQVETFDLPGSKAIPDDADLVILAAPEGEIRARERDILERYVLQGGSLFALLEPMGSAGADTLVSDFGVRADLDFVIDRSSAQKNVTNGASDRIAMASRANPKFEGTRGFNHVTLYPIARSLSSIQPPPPGVTVTRIVETAKEAYGETTLSQLGDPEASFDPGTDLPGPLALGYAIDVDLRVFSVDWRNRSKGLEQTIMDMNPGDFDRRGAGDSLKVGSDKLVETPRQKAKLVVMGDVDFVNNANLLAWGNGDLFLDLVLWLSEKENRIAIGPGPELFEPVLLTIRQRTWLRIIGIGVVPGIFLLLAIGAVWWRRKWV
ncbi:MAG TPA: Gldg family protein [Candidatus Krumholzibacteria bacterium]|nr:Gldg family protein [Candidatus Krumholzibacteria bacterium]